MRDKNWSCISTNTTRFCEACSANPSKTSLHPCRASIQFSLSVHPPTPLNNVKDIHYMICTIKKNIILAKFWFKSQKIQPMLYTRTFVFFSTQLPDTQPQLLANMKKNISLEYGGLNWRDTLALFLQYDALSKHNSEPSFFAVTTPVSFCILAHYILKITIKSLQLYSTWNIRCKKIYISWQNWRSSTKTLCRSNKLMKQVTRNYHLKMGLPQKHIWQSQ